MDKIKLRDRTMCYFTEITQHINPVVQSLKPQETLVNVYKMVGYITKCLAPLLFVQVLTHHFINVLHLFLFIHVLIIIPLPMYQFFIR